MRDSAEGRRATRRFRRGRSRWQKPRVTRPRGRDKADRARRAGCRPSRPTRPAGFDSGSGAANGQPLLLQNINETIRGGSSAPLAWGGAVRRTAGGEAIAVPRGGRVEQRARRALRRRGRWLEGLGGGPPPGLFVFFKRARCDVARTPGGRDLSQLLGRPRSGARPLEAFPLRRVWHGGPAPREESTARLDRLDRVFRGPNPHRAGPARAPRQATAA